MAFAVNLDAGRAPRAPLTPRRHRPVHEAVLVLPRAVDQVEDQLRAAIADAEGAKRAAPPRERGAEWEVRVLFGRDVPGHRESQVPWSKGVVALHGGQLAQ